MHELKINAVQADGTVLEMYNSDMDMNSISKELLNSDVLLEVQSEFKGQKLEYYYSSATNNNKVKEIAMFLQSLKPLLQYANIEGKVDNSLVKAGVVRITDHRAKLLECMPNANSNTLDLAESKFDKILQLMKELNEMFYTNRPSGLPGKEQYQIKHHFPSPKSLKGNTNEANSTADDQAN